ncbi:MAG: hypothetical protein H6625_09345 [Bdellovibrionaceae bacterium]|nr:hypothetical protein [Pseudobdellovibrionaceae bacterium]
MKLSIMSILSFLLCYPLPSFSTNKLDSLSVDTRGKFLIFIPDHFQDNQPLAVYFDQENPELWGALFLQNSTKNVWKVIRPPHLNSFIDIVSVNPEILSSLPSDILNTLPEKFSDPYFFMKLQNVSSDNSTTVASNSINIILEPNTTDTYNDNVKTVLRVTITTRLHPLDGESSFAISSVEGGVLFPHAESLRYGCNYVLNSSNKDHRNKLKVFRWNNERWVSVDWF